MVWSPLAGGLLSGKFSKEDQGPEGARRASFDFPPVDKDRAWKCIDAMREVGNTHGVSVARVALAYVLAKPFTTTVIIGAKNMEQLDDNLEATKLKLTADDMKKLDEVSQLPGEYPGWMLARQGAERIPQPK
jgi:aryl-alcohol dehydrogenase-like predicted oxidoreductase